MKHKQATIAVVDDEDSCADFQYTRGICGPDTVVCPKCAELKTRVALLERQLMDCIVATLGEE